MNRFIHDWDHLFQSIMVEAVPDNGFLLYPFLIINKEDALLVWLIRMFEQVELREFLCIDRNLFYEIGWAYHQHGFVPKIGKETIGLIIFSHKVFGELVAIPELLNIEFLHSLNATEGGNESLEVGVHFPESGRIHIDFYEKHVEHIKNQCDWYS